MKQLKIGDITIGGGAPLVVIAGPCVIESKESVYDIASGIQDICTRLDIPYIFKASYDKANRSSGKSFRGPGLEQGLAILSDVKKRLNMRVLSDVHEVNQIESAAAVLDVLQIPAFLCRQTDLLIAAARSGKIVNVKKGQFMSPWDMQNVVDKIRDAGNDQVMLTERGASFGYNNLVVDMRSLPVMRSMGCPVMFDATHSVQLPGGGGTCSSGQREFIPTLTRAAVATGIDALFLEVHNDPDHAKSDGPNMVPLNQLEQLLRQVQTIDGIVKRMI